MFLQFKRLCVVAAFILALGSTGFAQEKKDLDRAAKASQQLAEREAMKLLIYTSVLSSRVGEAIEIKPEVEQKYQNIRNGVFASLPMTAMGIAVGWSAKQCADEFKSVLKQITAIVTSIANGIYQSSHAFGELLERIGFRIVLEKIGNSFRSSADFLQLHLKSLVTGGAKAASATTVGAATLGGSSYLFWNNNSKDALDNSTVRYLLGYDSGLSAQIDKTTRELAVIFDLDASKQAVFKEALQNEAVALAIKNDFRRDADYTINLVRVLKNKNLISAEQALIAEGLQEIYSKSTAREVSEYDIKTLATHVDVIAALSAVLESYVESGKLSEKDEKEVQYLLAHSKRTLDRIRKYVKLSAEEGK